MYLRSIEVHGFKSFANKIKFEFHDGITVIVGPNGSGKSNVADAVRWVLGEQSAKQLRGSNMQDVIFSGSEARKPLGYAYVSITFDNSDHKLPITFDEVTVSRRVYRSGESEYLINGSNCRLKDIQELFMDTGIGKEGYSIIGQGQIERILSTKPEDRRELFDEAAGIVKFKKRKAIAEKNLSEERMNLSRVTDILLELENQIGPLEKQSEKAKEYLRLRDELRIKEANQFLMEHERNIADKSKIDSRYTIVTEDTKQTRDEYDNTKSEYEKIEIILNDYIKALDEGKNYKSELLLSIEKYESEKKLLEEQISSLLQNDTRILERMGSIDRDISLKDSEKEELLVKKNNISNEIKLKDSQRQEAVYNYDTIKQHNIELMNIIEECNHNIIHGMDNNAGIRTDIQKYQTLTEQNREKINALNIRKDESDAVIADLNEAVININKEIAEVKQKYDDCILQQKNLKLNSIESQNVMLKLKDDYEQKNHTYLKEQSKMESMINIAERYDGYGNSIRRVMEKKQSINGIHGVVADIIRVEKKYETAIETALGGSIQNIVTDNEYTAKKLIEFLKSNHFGRATFLPLTSIGDGKDNERIDVLNEKGVISYASTLVESEAIYNGVIRYLLGRIIVTDNIDNAIALAKKYKYSLRIVTLEGEQLNPGGAISGGAYKNNSNLLGRKRELEEMEHNVAALKSELKDLKEQQEKQELTISHIRSKLEKLKQSEQELNVEQNTVRMKLSVAQEKLQLAEKNLSDINRDIENCENQDADMQEIIAGLELTLSSADSIKKEYEEKIVQCNEELKSSREEEQKAADRMSALHIEYAELEKTFGFTNDNLNRILSELEVLLKEKENMATETQSSINERSTREDNIREIELKKEQSRKKLADLEIQIEDLNSKREELSKNHNDFFNRRDELSVRLMELEKESMRLQTQRDRLEEQINSQTEYLWNEYEMTPSDAENYRDAEIKSIAQNKKDIIENKNCIKALGDVNVNAIEDFKTVSERFGFLSEQKNDLLSAEQTLENIINELDDEMRKQFTEQFALIKTQFDSVFRELFGGGKASLELTEDEDVLEAGIIINAQPPGKKLQNMMQMSGGEKSLTAISLLFAIQNLKPSPFCLLDEIEAALDDPNVKRFANYLKKLTKNSQFIVITHRRGTMAAADILYGITMQEKGVSTLVSVNLIEESLN